MYGWINESLESLVESKFGKDIWQQIIDKAGCDVPPGKWIRHEYYADSTTYDLVGACSSLLGLEVANVLEIFGSYFMRHVKEEGYDNMMRCLGSDLYTWLANVNILHMHLSTTLPSMVPPQFWCEVDEEHTAIILHYKSHRGSGLAPLVVGIVREVADDYFGIAVEFERLATQNEDGSEFTTWRIREVGMVDMHKEGQGRSWPMTTVCDVGGAACVLGGMKGEIAGKCPFQNGSRLGDGDNGGDNYKYTPTAHTLVQEAKSCPFRASQEASQEMSTELEVSTLSRCEGMKSSTDPVHFDPVLETESSRHTPTVTMGNETHKKTSNSPHRLTTAAVGAGDVGDNSTSYWHRTDQTADDAGAAADSASEDESSSTAIPSLQASKKRSLASLLSYRFAQSTCERSHAHSVSRPTFVNGDSATATATPGGGAYRTPLFSNTFRSWEDEETHPTRLCKRYAPTSNTVRPAKSIGLSGNQLEEAFTFHIIFTDSLRIVQHGDSLSEFFSFTGKSILDATINELFDIRSPNTVIWSDWPGLVSGFRHATVELVSKVTPPSVLEPLRLTGQMLFSADNSMATFLATPNVATLKDMTLQGVTFEHLSVHDCRKGMIMVNEHRHSETEAGVRFMTIMKQLEEEKNKRIALMKSAAEEAENMLATKRAFVRYVSHEIRTPLSVCKLGLDLIQSQVGTVCDEPCLENLRDCQDSIDIAVTILNDLLSYEKLESGIMQLYQEIRPAVSFISRTLSPFSLQARQKNIQFSLHVSVADSDDIYIYVDNSKMSQVIRNLVSNALKFTPPYGKVAVEVKVVPASDITSTGTTKSTTPNSSSTSSGCDSGSVDIGIPEVPSTVTLSAAGASSSLSPSSAALQRTIEYKCDETRCLRVEFVDTGVGISESNQHRVFKEIVQFSPNELQAGGGSGLGLWISSGITTMHGGRVGMYSEGEGKGSTFFFEIPIYTHHVRAASSTTTFTGYGEDYPKRNGVTGLQSQVPATPMGPSEHCGDYQCTDDKDDDMDRSAAENEKNILFGKSVLIVDDAVMIRKLLHRTLAAKGSICTDAEDGIDALCKIFTPRGTTDSDSAGDCTGVCESGDRTGMCLSICATQSESEIVNMIESKRPVCKNFDIILMDFVMPNLDGLGAVRILRRLGYNGIIIGATGNMMPGDVEAFRNAGADVILAKPLMVSELEYQLQIFKKASVQYMY